MIAAFAVLLIAQAAPAPADTVTDARILAFAAAPWDKQDRGARLRELGVHHGTRVLVDYPCSDVCPSYTTRIIHYAVEPGPDCTRIGGVVREAVIPRGIASNRKSFCVPAVLGTQLIPLGGG
ncbi:MAG: hypothetical protein J7500_13800 [Sphingomonas sp.]|uniref:hypothetical protein n=1 Tax=Sphingomonas sp. TaxID=28214 RepID=UPI001B155ED2|nr:hypothetical protein [Sphingomonas sp.]MBO9623776.1 hypothetical protein [Sphingomonas sp.]